MSHRKAALGMSLLELRDQLKLPQDIVIEHVSFRSDYQMCEIVISGDSLGENHDYYPGLKLKKVRYDDV